MQGLIGFVAWYFYVIFTRLFNYHGTKCHFRRCRRCHRGRHSRRGRRCRCCCRQRCQADTGATISEVSSARRDFSKKWPLAPKKDRALNFFSRRSDFLTETLWMSTYDAAEKNGSRSVSEKIGSPTSRW